MLINCLSDQGNGKINEDAILWRDNLFGVFDGATSLNSYIDEQGHTGGYLASNIARDCFSSNDAPLYDLALYANQEIQERMLQAGIETTNKKNRWSTTAGVIRIVGDEIEWLQVADTYILAIRTDGSSEQINPVLDHDLGVMHKWKKLAENKEANIFNKLLPDIIELRERMNIDYGVINGEENLIPHIKTGTTSLQGIKHLLIFSDGMGIPKEEPSAELNFEKTAELFFEGGLLSIRNYVRELEKSDPLCWKYPRYKMHDDIGAISISL